MSVSETGNETKERDDIESDQGDVPVKVAGATMTAAGSVVTRTSGCVSENFGGRTPVPPAMRAAQQAEDIRRSHGTHVGHSSGPKAGKKAVVADDLNAL